MVTARTLVRAAFWVTAKGDGMYLALRSVSMPLPFCYLSCSVLGPFMRVGTVSLGSHEQSCL